MVITTVELLSTQQVLNREINVYGNYENPLFLAKDVAEWIDYAKTSKGAYDVSNMLKGIDEDEKLVRTIFISGQNRSVWMLTESGLYEILMLSRKPIAKAFKKEVKVILNNIRKHGMYMASAQMYSIPQTLSEALFLASEQATQIEEQNKQLLLQEPSVRFAKALEDSEDYSLIAELAKILSQEGVKVGQNRLYEWLRQNKYLCAKGSYRNQPTQRAINMKLFRIVKAETKSGSTTKLTSKGTAYFIKKFLCEPCTLKLNPKRCK